MYLWLLFGVLLAHILLTGGLSSGLLVLSCGRPLELAGSEIVGAQTPETAHYVSKWCVGYSDWNSRCLTAKKKSVEPSHTLSVRGILLYLP